MPISRRKSIKQIGTGIAASSLFGFASLTSCNNSTKGKEMTTAESPNSEPLFKISLAQWSLHRTFFGNALDNGFDEFGKALQTDPDSLLRGMRDPIEFPTMARQEFGLDAVEFVNTFYFSKAKNMPYINELKKRCADEGVQPVLIMCDALGDLGNLKGDERQKAVENHYPWVDIAKYLGCHAIRVNAAGTGTADEVKDAAVQGLGALTEYGKENEISIIVENHGGYSSNGEWLASVMTQVNDPYCGTLPDFGNFCITRNEDFSCKDEYDRYKGVAELMPFAKGVSAKTHEFDGEGNEKFTDYRKMLKIVTDAGYNGYIDIEYEGRFLKEPEGIVATKKLLEKIRDEMS